MPDRDAAAPRAAAHGPQTRSARTASIVALLAALALASVALSVTALTVTALVRGGWGMDAGAMAGMMRRMDSDGMSGMTHRIV